MTEHTTDVQADRYGPDTSTHRAGGGSHRRAGNGKHRARSRSAAKPLLTVVAVAATAAGAVVGSKVMFTSGPQDDRTAAAPEPSLANGITPVTPSGSIAASTTPSPQSTGPTRLPSASTSTVPVQRPATSAAAPTSPLAAVPAPARSTPRATATAGSGTGLDAAASQVLAVINQARAAQGVAPLQMVAGLQTSANAHNHTMAAGCGLSHQCPGEAAFGDREHAAGVQWGTAGENIGEGGPMANTTDAIAGMAVGLTNDMLAEQAPNDGHRRNILNPAFHHIGIQLLRDSSGTVWMTQDFSD
ncbi:CAP domain-containing protein [Kitasatospora paranensis]|uniref:CAP domain-containing protein n=1 Tax=Kitasatospora paranensis TaxID=258053 RepID=A0ABW2G727_9ACTN